MCKPSIRIKYFIHTYRDSFFAKVKRSERGQFSVSDTLDSGIERNGIDKRLVLYRVLAFPPSVFSQQSDFHCRIPYWQFSPFTVLPSADRYHVLVRPDPVGQMARAQESEYQVARFSG